MGQHGRTRTDVSLCKQKGPKEQSTSDHDKGRNWVTKGHADN